MTPYEPNPAKAIADCKGDINKLAMECEIAKSAFASALIHMENLLNVSPNIIAHIDFALARQFLDAAKHKNGHVNVLAQKYESAVSQIMDMGHRIGVLEKALDEISDYPSEIIKSDMKCRAAHCSWEGVAEDMARIATKALIHGNGEAS
jgi:hypothetical protein